MDKLTGGERIVLAAGAVVVIDLFLLPWHFVESLTPQGRAVDEGITAVQSPLALLGVIAAVIALVMITHIVLARFTSVQIPEPPIPWAQVHLLAGVAVLALLLLKALLEARDLGLGCYAGIVAAAVLAYGGWVVSQEAVAQRSRAGKSVDSASKTPAPVKGRGRDTEAARRSQGDRRGDRAQ